MSKMMKLVNSKIVENGIDMIFRISSKSAKTITGIKTPFDAEITAYGVVWFENGKAYISIEADNENQGYNMLTDMLNNSL